MTRFTGSLPSVLGFAAAMLLAAGQTAFAQSQEAQGTAEVAPAATDSAAAGTVRELQQRMSGGSVVALRKTTNGGYEAQLLFDRQSTTYYVALLQQDNFWRVLKTADEVRANANYAMFIRQTERLADIEMQRTRVETQKAQMDHRLVAAREKERRLQADLDVALEQQKLAADRGQEDRNLMLELQAQQDAARAELKETLSRIAKLQKQEKMGVSAPRVR